MKIHVFEKKVWLPCPLADVFAFFANASNLDAITPPWLPFRTLTTGEIAMRPGTRIDYELRYAVPGGALVNALFVARDIEKIFEFRSHKLKELFPPGPHHR